MMLAVDYCIYDVLTKQFFFSVGSTWKNWNLFTSLSKLHNFFVLTRMIRIKMMSRYYNQLSSHTKYATTILTNFFLPLDKIPVTLLQKSGVILLHFLLLEYLISLCFLFDWSITCIVYLTWFGTVIKRNSDLQLFILELISFILMSPFLSYGKLIISVLFYICKFYILFTHIINSRVTFFPVCKFFDKAFE